ncbi:hypothetical protein GCM10023145_33650 [Angustibacter luteus]
MRTPSGSTTASGTAVRSWLGAGAPCRAAPAVADGNGGCASADALALLDVLTAAGWPPLEVAQPAPVDSASSDSRSADARPRTG